MMLGSSHPFFGLDVATGTFVLMIFSAGVALVALAVLIRLLLRRAGQSGATPVWLTCGLALVGGVLCYAVFDRFAVHEQAADRRALETRAAELTARSLAPGSALGCLDAVASSLVENACERPLFASPEAVAAAVDYVDARFSLLAPSAALAARDPSYQPALERLRRGLESDRYGLVAHVLITRGCNGADCAELRLLRDPARVVANMKARAFEASLGAHALAWQASGTGPAGASASPHVAVHPPTATGALAPGGANAPGGSASGGASKFDFPSASSIPAVSIMNPEPSAPPTAEPRSSTPAPKRSAPPPPPRRQSAREATAPSPPPPPPVPAPTPQAAPEAAPEPAAPTRPDPHSAR